MRLPGQKTLLMIQCAIFCCLFAAIDSFKVSIGKDPLTLDTPKGPIKFTRTESGVMVKLDLKGVTEEEIMQIKEQIKNNPNLLPVAET